MVRHTKKSNPSIETELNIIARPWPDLPIARENENPVDNNAADEG